MKKTIAFIAIVIFTLTLLTSCQSSKKCPAYSKSNTSKTEVKS